VKRANQPDTANPTIASWFHVERVRGVVRSRLHRGGTEENPSPFPAQWIVWLEVTEVEILKDVYDVLK